MSPAVCYRYAITLEVVASHGSLALFHSSEFPDGGHAAARQLACPAFPDERIARRAGAA
eukprot:COSAG02_NODE_67384_length_253_cov_0.662338_1_plen_58_part_01